MFVMVVTAVLYTSIGGMRASILTDFVQAVVMAAAVSVAIPLSLHFIGGIGTVNSIFQSFNPSFVGQALSTADIVGFMAAFGFSIAAAPYDITRIYSMKDEKTVRQAIRITLIFQAIIGTSVAVLVVVSLGLGVYLLTTNPPKDESSFLGVGEEKLSDEELADTDR